MAGEETCRRPQEGPDGPPRACKSRLLSWRLVGALLAFLVVLGWVFIIVVLILEEKWQLVLVAWLLLYSAAHFCYWYCKRHSLITLHRQIRLRVLTNVRPGEQGLKAEDLPPPYDEVMGAEAPPPAYFAVVSETASEAPKGPRKAAAAAEEPIRGPIVRQLLLTATAASTEEASQEPPPPTTPPPEPSVGVGREDTDGGGSLQAP